MDTPAATKLTAKLGAGLQQAKVTNSAGSRPVRPHADHRAVEYRQSRGTEKKCAIKPDANIALDELCNGLTDALWDQSARMRALKATGASIKTHFSDLAKDTAGNSRDPSKCQALLSDDSYYYPDKASGADRMPSEIWKLVMAQKTPTSDLAKIIYKIIKMMFDSGNIPKNMNTSLVVPVPKKGDMRDPDNYRDISLIPTLIKLLAKIVASKLARLDNKYKLIVKEQEGFRNLEKCVAQATTLYEIAKRRVEVPGIPSRIPGLLFADDAVVLADSAKNLQTSLDDITVWSDTWEMAVNASKCAIMAVNCDDPAVMYAGYYFLNRSDVLTELKIRFINSFLLPIGCYGGETFGMSENRCRPIQTVIDQATHIVAKEGKNATMEQIREELGISSVFLCTSTARERAFIKWPASKAWIADLINQPIKV
ncbi:hypothetical protein AYI70_g3184 [Smittium culicis]|uniref:RNA-directed DNA polymerase from mobile element jockey n=1 Tax=Smittium culicis TaxID=133412 RepID=A0A1R1Y4Z9_9FUNG|nr:hypothetical protein AYI70_g3184 [Smittium culicis]